MNKLHSYTNLGPGVVAFSTTREGGVSRGNYGTMNVNAYCGDDAACVAGNRRRLCAWLGLGDVSRLVMPHQNHGTAVRQVTQDFLRLSPDDRQPLLEGVDAVMTDVEDICIGVSTADCIPIIIYDHQHRAACAVHAGWRGTVARIAEKAVGAMRWAYGSRPDQLLAVIGPGISLNSFEVGNEVYDQFLHAGFPMPAISRRQPAARPAYDGEERWHLDLPHCNRMQLINQGLAAANVLNTAICTYDHTDRFFSARRLGTASGRIFTGVVIKKVH